MGSNTNTLNTIEEEPMQTVTLKVLNPVATIEIEGVKTAERLANLNNKRIGLYWNRKARGDVALRKVAAVIRKRFTGVEFTWFEIENSIALVPEQLKSIEQLKNDAIISATGD